MNRGSAMRLRIGLLLCLALVCCCGLAVSAEQVKYRLILQVSEDSVDRLMVALNNARNVQQQFGPEHVEVQIVVFSGGVQTVKFYAPIPVAERVKQAKYEGVRLLVCENSMRAAKLTPSQMLQEVGYVPSGVAEIVEKVSQGWVNVKP